VRNFRSNSAQNSVHEHIQALAYIFYKWILENSTECNNWVKDAPDIQKVYNAVKQNCISQ
jgi:hypothetical protein